jgi:hypothetical protein
MIIADEPNDICSSKCWTGDTTELVRQTGMGPSNFTAHVIKIDEMTPRLWFDHSG